MRFRMVVKALLCGQLFVFGSALKAQEGSPPYVGDKEFRVTYYQKHLFVLSNHAEQAQVNLWRHQNFETLRRTTQPDSNLPAWVSPARDFKENEVIHVEIAYSSNKWVKALKVIRDKEGLRLIIVPISEHPLPAQPVIAGNQVNAAQFIRSFNSYRQRYGLAPVKFSRKLTSDAAHNNAMQQRYGLGHHFMGSSSGQNSADGYNSIPSVLNGWHNSSGHRTNMQGRNWRCMGIHRSGRYWTQNFSSWKDCQ